MEPATEKRKRIAILGTRGIPASYSGFETSVEETAPRFAARGYPTRVYCRRNHYENRPQSHKGVRLIFLPSIKSKHLDTISHTTLSVLHLLLHRCDVVVLYGLGNAIFIPLLRMFGMPVVSVLDGADWRRSKWGGFAQWFLRSSRRLAVHTANSYVIDNEGLAREYEKAFGRQPVYIPYGAKADPDLEPAVLQAHGLERRGYIIFVGRFVREKNIEGLIENYKKLDTETKLVVVGGNPLDGGYERAIRELGDERVIFTGMVYGAQFETLLSQALFYVSCSGLEGTSPALLSAMALNGFALVADIPENRETLKGSCATFPPDEPAKFRELLSYYLSHPDEVERARERTKATVSRHYDWERIAERYLAIVERLSRNGQFRALSDA